jgi:hypothetical protein
MNEGQMQELRDLKNKLNQLQRDFDKLKTAILLHPEIGDRIQKNIWS